MGSVRHRGFRTSAAANVTLFQASDENSEPTIAPPATITRPIVNPKPVCSLTSTYTRDCRGGALPQRLEILSDGGGIRGHRKADDDDHAPGPASWRR